MDSAAETTSHFLPPIKGDHPVLTLPFTVGIDGRNHAGRGLSLVSAEISGLVDPALAGADRLVRLIFPFNGFTVVLSLRARIQQVEPGEGRATLVFLDPAGEHLPQLRHILNSWIAGDLVSLGETIGVTATHTPAGQRPATPARARSRRALGTLGMTAATVTLLALAAGTLVTRSYAVPLSLPGAVTWDSRALSAVAAGQIDYINPDAAKGEVAFALRATTGETLSIAMPCYCDAEPAGPVAGSTVLAGEPVLVLKDADARLIVTAPVLPDDLSRLAFTNRVEIDFADGSTATAALDATRLVPAAGTDPQPLRLIPDSPLPPSAAGQSVALTALKPMPAILDHLAITMAFGALVGQLDPVICDRAGRIAREYLGGTIVTRNVPMAEKWYRFAADLGDASAAWKVAEMHLRSEDLTKDNDTLVTYLTKAADGGLPHAQAALGRAYELGTLVPQDLNRARQLHDAAAADGDRGGLIRLTLFLLQQQQDDPALRPDYLDSLHRLAARDDAPSWALASLADAILQDQGRWAGEQAATELLQRAADMGDTSAAQRLAALRFRHVSEPDAFYAVVDDLIASVQMQGNIDPMAELQNAFTCRAPDAPHKDEAAYWRTVEDAAASRSLELGPADIRALAENPDPLTLATLQSQALYGRPTAIANYLALLRRTKAPQATIAFWEEHARRSDKAILSAARLSVAEATADPARVEALENLLPLAQSGIGSAMRLLPKADPNRWPDLDAVWRDFAPVIDARGDFDAMLIALPRAGDEQVQADYLHRATASTACTFDQTILLTEVLGQMKATRAFRQWIDITEYLAEGDGWRLTRLGDVLIRYGTPSDADRAVGYFETAMADGSNTAIHRLLRQVSRSELPSYDPARATELYIELVRRSDPVELPRTLARLAGEEEEIRTATEAAIDIPALYRSAAEAGSPIGMREYARLLQARADNPQELAQATDWMHRAAEAGDMDAMVSYAEALALGIGTPPSREAAVLWLSRAAELGSEQAAATMRNLRMSQGLSQ